MVKREEEKDAWLQDVRAKAQAEKALEEKQQKPKKDRVTLQELIDTYGANSDEVKARLKKQESDAKYRKKKEMSKGVMMAIEEVNQGGPRNRN